MVSHLTASPLFERLPNAALRADPAVAVLPKTDEGLKVRRNNGNMFIAVYRKRLDPLAPRPEPPLLGNDVAAAAAADAGYAPVAGGEPQNRAGVRPPARAHSGAILRLATERRRS